MQVSAFLDDEACHAWSVSQLARQLEQLVHSYLLQQLPTSRSRHTPQHQQEHTNQLTQGASRNSSQCEEPCCQPVLGTQTSPTQSATMDCMLCTAYLVVAITTATAWSSWNTTLAESTGWSTGSLENLHARISTHVLPVHAKTCPLQIPTLSTRLSVTLHAAPWSLTPVLGCGRKQGCVLGGKTLAAMEYACTESARCAASRMGILPPFHPAPRVRACVYI